MNAEGGVLGKKLRLAVGDDQCDPKRAVRVANNLVEQGVVFVDGHFCSGSSIPASEVYQEAGILQITPSSTNPIFDGAGHRHACSVPPAATTGRARSRAHGCAKNYAGKNVAVIDDGSPYGTRLGATRPSRAMKANGCQPSPAGHLRTDGRRDFSALIAQAQVAQTSTLSMSAAITTILRLLVRQAREQGFAGAFAAADALNTAEFWSHRRSRRRWRALHRRQFAGQSRQREVGGREVPRRRL